MIKAYIKEQDYGSKLMVAFVEDRPDGNRYVYIPHSESWSRIDEIPDDCGSFIITRDMLEALIEELAKRGFKSGREERIAGELMATKLHLGDMRKIVFKK